MSTNYEFKKIGDVDVIESINDFAHVIIEDSGVLKKMAAKNIGAVKTVNGAAPDADGNVQIEIEAGASSWNDLTDKPFYDAGNKIEIPVFNGKSLVFDEDMDATQTNPAYFHEVDPSKTFAITAGNTYYVTIDGETYTTESAGIEGTGYIGNLNVYAAQMPSTGEPFFIANMFGESLVMALNIPGETHDISIIEVKTGIEKEIIPEMEYTFGVEDLGMLPMMSSTNINLSGISEGDTVNITINGEAYTNTVSSIEDGMIVVFGNLGFEGMGEDTGEPYMGMYIPSLKMGGMYVLTETTTNKFSIDKILDDGSYENIIPEGTHEFTNTGDGPYYVVTYNDSGYVLETNTNYRVMWNDVEYTVTSATENYGTEEEPDISIFIKTDSTPFGFFYNQDNTFDVAHFVDESFTTTHTIEINAIVSGVKKLDKKYLPDHEHEINLPIASNDELGCVKISGYRTSSSDGSELSTSGYYSEIYIDSKTDKIYTKAPKIHMSMTDLTAGVSSLESGKIYLVYE